jgi:hypothetical protein
MSRRPGNRKGNYASYVKRTMPVAAVSPAMQGVIKRQYSTSNYTPEAG